MLIMSLNCHSSLFFSNIATTCTAMVYVHRFYALQSLRKYHRNYLASAAFFLACKVEDQRVKLKDIIITAYACSHPELPLLKLESEDYKVRK